MLEKPLIPDEQILSRLQEEFELHAARLAFLPIGADLRTAVYRVTADDGTAYFLKLRKNFDEVTVLVPLFLKEGGIREILVPHQTRSKQYWADFGEYRLILYPYIEGKDGFERELTDRHRQILGSALKGIHTAQLPPELRKSIRKETYSWEWRDSLRSYQVQVESKTFADVTASKLADFIKLKQGEITRLIERAGQLALQIRSRDLVLCHSDIHGGNILIRTDGQPPLLYIVDWDEPILAPKERDLMFIGGGIDEIWKSRRDEAVFYEGYGNPDIDLSALAYYRYERVIEDLVVICDQLFLTDEGGANREQSYGWFTDNFEPGNTIEIADNTYSLIP